MGFEVEIGTEFIRLTQFLKWCNVAENGGMASEMVRAGKVKVNGEVCGQRGKKLRDGDMVEVEGKEFLVKGQ